MFQKCSKLRKKLNQASKNIFPLKLIFLYSFSPNWIESLRWLHGECNLIHKLSLNQNYYSIST